ncbi:MAG: hypothetical protein RIR56_747 [Bacteroidota bacterium]|jgi:hypothetical protein
MKFLNSRLKLFIFLAFTLLNAQEKFLFSGEMNKKPIKVEISFKGNNNASGFLQDLSTKENFPIFSGNQNSKELSFITRQSKDENSNILIEHCDIRLLSSKENQYFGMANCGGEEFEIKLHPNSNQKLENAKIVSAKEIPDEIFKNNKISKSEIIKAYQYKDKLGFHYTFIAKKGPEFIKTLPHEMEDSQDIELFAQSFLLNSETKNYDKEWQIYDLVNDCPLDISGDFFSEAFQITDVNQNNLSEVWILYKLGCRGGVDPLDMKIIMYENGKKYAMRGTEKIIISYNKNTKNNNYTGGKYTYDEAFLNSKDQKILEFSKKLWNKYVFTPQD